MLDLMQESLRLPSFDLFGVELALSIVLSFDGWLLGFVVVGLTVGRGFVEDLFGESDGVSLQNGEGRDESQLEARKKETKGQELKGRRKGRRVGFGLSFPPSRCSLW